MVDFNAIIHIVSMTFLYAMGATIAEIIVMKVIAVRWWVWYDWIPGTKYFAKYFDNKSVCLKASNALSILIAIENIYFVMEEPVTLALSVTIASMESMVLAEIVEYVIQAKERALVQVRSIKHTFLKKYTFKTPRKINK